MFENASGLLVLLPALGVALFAASFVLHALYWIVGYAIDGLRWLIDAAREALTHAASRLLAFLLRWWRS